MNFVFERLKDQTRETKNRFFRKSVGRLSTGHGGLVLTGGSLFSSLLCYRIGGVLNNRMLLRKGHLKSVNKKICTARRPSLIFNLSNYNTYHLVLSVKFLHYDMNNEYSGMASRIVGTS